MADNFTFTEGSGATGGAKNVGGVLYPQVILTEEDGSNTGLAAAIGPLTETAPSTDTASSGLNGRLQRIAQRLTSLTALIPAALTGSGNFKVAIQESTATVAVSASALPLPSGASTAAKQPALGTAGTPSSDVLTVQGASSMTALKVDGSGVTQPVSGTVTANAGTNLNTSALALEGGGHLAAIDTAQGTQADTAWTSGNGTVIALLKGIFGKLAGTITASISGSVAVTGTFWQSTQPVSIADGSNTTLGAKADAKNSATDTTAISIMSVLKQISASIQTVATWTGSAISVATHAVTQSGTWTVATNADGTSGSAVPSKGLLVQGSDGTDARNLSTTSAGVLKVDMSATAVNSTAIKVDGSGVTQPVSLATNTPVIATGSNIIGKVGIDQTTPGTTNGVTPVPAASGGPTVQRIKAAASTNATSVKTSAGQIYGYALYNNTASAKFFKVYNKASSPTVGTDTPAFTVIIPASGGANISWDMGIPLGTGVAFAITGAVADSDTTSTAADDVHGVLLYK